uniref:Uncharacterized protein n=1 Tax=Zea mays TaxID=4577 RepID=B6TEM0_MAIZE|nr:hypothetical protein [Zea mays]
MGPSSLGVLGGPPLFAWRWTRPRLRQDCSGTSLLNPTFWKSSWRSCIIKRNRSRNTSELATFPWWNVWTISGAMSGILSTPRTPRDIRSVACWGASVRPQSPGCHWPTFVSPR